MSIRIKLESERGYVLYVNGISECESADFAFLCSIAHLIIKHEVIG